MAIKKETIETLKGQGITIDGKNIKIFGIDVAALSAAIEAETEVEFEAKIVAPKEMHLLTEVELTDIKTRAKQGHEEAFPEILAKKAKDELGMKDFKGKDPIELAKAYAELKAKEAVGAAKLPVDQKVKELEDSLEVVRGNLVLKEQEVVKKEQEVLTFKNQYDSVLKINEFAKILPANHNPLLRPEEYEQRIKTTYGIEGKIENGVMIAIDTATGKPFKDSHERVIPLKVKIDEVFAKEPNWIKAETPPPPPPNGNKPPRIGNGAGPNGNGSNEEGRGDGKIRNMSEFKQYAKDNKLNTIQQQREYAKVVSENPEFDPNA